MKKITITMTETQARVIIDSLDLYSRLLMGQFGEIDRLFRFHSANQFWKDSTRANELRYHMDAARKVLIPGIDPNAYYSICDQENTPVSARTAYDISREMEHDLAWNRNPNGGITTNYDKPLHANKSEPLITVEIVELIS